MFYSCLFGAAISDCPIIVSTTSLRTCGRAPQWAFVCLLKGPAMTKRRLQPLLLACSSIVALQALMLATASAQQAAPLQGTSAANEQTALPTIVVKGSRVREGAPEDTPVATRTTAEQINEREIGDIDDLGNTTEPGVTFVEATKSINIRGLEGDRVLTTIDGIPIPYLSDGVRGSQGGVDTFDFSAISTIDVVRGADSSRAGSGALAGALILRTLEPEDLIDDGATVGGLAKLTYDGTDDGIMASGAVAKHFDATSVLFQSSYKVDHGKQSNGDVGGYGPTRTVENPGDVNRRNMLFKVRQAMEGGHTLGLTLEHYDQNGTADYRSLQGVTYRPGDYDLVRDKKRDRVSLDYRFDAEDPDSIIDTAFASVYLQRSERIEGTHGTRITAPVGYYMRSSTNEDRSYGASGYATSTFDTGDLSHQLTLGGDVSFAQTSQYQVGQDNCAVTPTPNCAFFHNNQADMPDTDGYKLGLYAEDKIGLGATNVSLTPGLRLDWYEYDPKATARYTGIGGSTQIPDGQSDLRLSPKLLGAWQVRPDVELFAKVSATFRAPNVKELYLNYDNAPQYRSIGNPDLDPETGVGIEAGVNFGDEDLGGRLTAYSNRYKNFIDSVTTPEAGYAFGSIAYLNRNRVRISGVEARGQMTFGSGFNVHGAISYARGTDLETNDVIASVPPLKAVLGAGYDTETWGTDVSLVTAAAVDDRSLALSRPAGYGVVNLTGWWEPEEAKGLRIQAGVYNLFDKTYLDALEVKDVVSATAFYSEPGRILKVSLTQAF
jgi:hemoglobin/transferrin/lactoferrin receptor protein